MVNQENAELLTKFYTAFQQRDYKTMAQCYHPKVHFSDPAFPDLVGKKACAMWHMLCESAKSDFALTFDKIAASDKSGLAHWEPTYTFSRTGRKVHNIIDAVFVFEDGKIIRHQDKFDLWRWSGMALGTSGSLLGWTPFMRKKIREMAAKNLDKFISSHPEYQ